MGLTHHLRELPMYGDTTAIRHLASRLRRQAAEIRAAASLLRARSLAAPWQGRGAEAMRASAGRQARSLRHTADLHDEAATSLVRHAQAVDEVKALIASIERHVHSLIDAARSRLGDLVGNVADPLDDLLDRFSPPLTGSLDWLDLHLPGLPGGGLPGAA